MSISTHVLDTARGRPASGLVVTLERKDDDGWSVLAQAATDGEGRVSDLLGGGVLRPAVHRLTFATGAYHDEQGTTWFHPEVTIVFEVEDANEHYHVPLLLSPYGYTTYRGS